MTTDTPTTNEPASGRPNARPARPTRAAGLGAAALAPLGIVILLALVVWLGLRPLSAVPDVVPAGASPLVFSAERAMAGVRALTGAPRPVGSAANADARDYLLAEITALGLEPQVQATAVMRHEPGFPETHLMPVENILVRVPGSAPGGKALLVSGHYDSVATAGGASDCGMCAAVTLETLRAVVAGAAAGQPPHNDIIFLFTDAEEIGVAGALGFMRDHPWAADVGLSVVFEGLGTDGAPLLYISGPDSGAVVGEALDAMQGGSGYPLASSFLHDFMWTVAGNTGSDLDAFVEGAPGLGFIYLSLETVAGYHTNADSVANLDPRSVQGMGDFALAMTRHFGDRPLDDLPQAPNLVMFPLWPGLVARYSSAAALPLAIVAGLLLAAYLVVGLRRRELSAAPVLAGFAAWPVGLLLTVAAVSLAWWLARLLTPGLHNFTAGGWWGGGFYLAASLALALAVIAFGRYIMRRLAPADLLMGGALWWAFLALLTAATLPGLSYLFVWPLLVIAVGGLWASFFPAGDYRRALPPVAAAAVAMLLFAPAAYWLWIYAGRAEAMMGLPMAALPVLFVWPALWLAVAAFAVATARSRPLQGKPQGREGAKSRDVNGDAPLGSSQTGALGLNFWPPIILLALSAFLFIAPALMRPDATRPWANAVVYTLDAARGKAKWVTFNDSRMGRGTRHQLDEWTSRFFPAVAEATTFDPWLLTRSDTPYPALQAAAPVVELPRTAVAIDGAAGRTRLIVARPAEAWLTRLVVHSAAPITGITLDGAPLDLGGTQPAEYTFLVIGRDDEVIIDLATRSAGVTIDTLDRLTTDVIDIAARAGLAVPPRPAWMTAAAASDTADGALVTARYD